MMNDAMRTVSAPVTLTAEAANRVRALVAQGARAAGAPVLGLRVSVSSKGCSGLSYVFDYARSQEPADEVVEIDGARLFIDGGALLFLLGSRIDYLETPLESRFVFENPNAVAHCGCGESFTVSE